MDSPVTASPPAEPQAEQRPLERTLHNLRLIDEDAWLKAENWREVMRDPFQLDPAIRAYLQAELYVQSPLQAEVVQLVVDFPPGAWTSWHTHGAGHQSCARRRDHPVTRRQGLPTNAIWRARSLIAIRPGSTARCVR